MFTGSIDGHKCINTNSTLSLSTTSDVQKQSFYNEWSPQPPNTQKAIIKTNNKLLFVNKATQNNMHNFGSDIDSAMNTLK